MSLSEYCNLAFLRGNVSFENVSFEMCLLKCVFLIFIERHISKGKCPFLKCAFWIIFRKTHFKRDISLLTIFCLLKFVFQKKIRQTEMSLLKRHITSFQKGHFPEKRLNAGKTHFSLQKGNVPFKRDICLFRGKNSTW